MLSNVQALHCSTASIYHHCSCCCTMLEQSNTAGPKHTGVVVATASGFIVMVTDIKICLQLPKGRTTAEMHPGKHCRCSLCLHLQLHSYSREVTVAELSAAVSYSFASFNTRGLPDLYKKLAGLVAISKHHIMQHEGWLCLSWRSFVGCALRAIRLAAE